MYFNRKIIFQGIKDKLDSSLNQGQVDGINFLLDNFEKHDNYWDDLKQISYAFATVYHETAYSFQPVAEGYYLGDSNKPNYFQGNTQRVFNFQKSLRYYPDFGRGYVQLTWDYNYRDQDKKIRQYLPEIVEEFETKTGEIFSLIKYPEQAFDPDIAFAIMTIGMHFGTFRPGHTLDRYINNKKCDYIYARYIINGRKKGEKLPDKAEQITVYAKKFESILKSSLSNEINSEEEFQKTSSNKVIVSELTSENESIVEEQNDLEKNSNVDQSNVQNAEQITNIDQSEKSIPDNFVPEDKESEAPRPSGTLSKAWKSILALGLIPTTGAGVIESIRSLSSDESINWQNILEVMKVIFIFILPYLFWLAIVFIIIWGVKELLKQVSFIVNNYTLARADMHNIKIVPFKEETKKEIKVKNNSDSFSIL